VDELTIIEEMAIESIVRAKLKPIFGSHALYDPDKTELELVPDTTDAARQRLHDRERRLALTVASVWMAVAEQLKEDSWQN
jgi:hypothetical protein